MIGIAEWMMGANRTDRATVRTVHHSQRLTGPIKSLAEPDGAPEKTLTALLATQLDRSAGFGGGTAFLAMADADDWTCDRRECFDARGALVLPEHFDQRSGGGSDPCAALSARFLLTAGESVERVCLLGYAETLPAARHLAAVATMVAPVRRMEQARNTWDKLLGATTVKTPEPLFDAMVNRWLLYQTVACCLWAKAGFAPQLVSSFPCSSRLLRRRPFEMPDGQRLAPRQV